MKSSVIIPTLNEEDTIEECLQTLHDQQESVGEILVVDSHSDDNTRELAQRNGARVIESDPGKLTARNVGATHAQGEILLFADADRRYPSDWSQNLLRHFDDPGVVAVSGGSHSRSGDEMQKVWTRMEDVLGDVFVTLGAMASGGYFMDGGSSAIRKDPYLAVGGLREVKPQEDELPGINLARVWLEEEVFFPRRLEQHGRILLDEEVKCEHKSRRLRALLDPTDSSDYAEQVRQGERF